MPCGAQEPTVARTHRLIRIRERQGVPIAAERACTGVDSCAAARNGELPPTERTLYRHSPRPALVLHRASPAGCPGGLPPEPPQPEPHDVHAFEGRRRKGSMDPVQRVIADDDPLSPRSYRRAYQILIFVILWMGSPGTLPKCHLSTVALVAGAPSLGTYSKVTLLSPVQIWSTP